MSDLRRARELSHAAIQWPSKAARANLPAEPDDSHSSLTWIDKFGALTSLPLDGAGCYQLAFSFQSSELLWLSRGSRATGLSLTDAANEAVVEEWVNQQLETAGLHTTDKADMPYELEPISGYVDDERGLKNLGVWYSTAHDALTGLIDLADHSSMKTTGAPVVRCWPHHFDMATLFSLGEDRSIGVGFSPGDESYDEPYFYCSPWPHPDPTALPVAPDSFHWHTEGFTALVATVSVLETRRNLDQSLFVAVSGIYQTLKPD